LSFEDVFKAKIVSLILQKKPEIALEILSRKYSIRCPSLKVGTVKRSSKSLGVYVHSSNIIYVSSSDRLNDPHVILHEFYHHLRSTSGRHRGTEKYATKFANDYIASFVSICKAKRIDLDVA
jgi:hypothetical protein